MYSRTQAAACLLILGWATQSVLVSVQSPPRAVVVIRVTDLDGRRPLANVDVLVKPSKGTQPPEIGSTDAEGTFTTQAVTGSRVVVEVSKLGFVLNPERSEHAITGTRTEVHRWLIAKEGTDAYLDRVAKEIDARARAVSSEEEKRSWYVAAWERVRELPPASQDLVAHLLSGQEYLAAEPGFARARSSETQELKERIASVRPGGMLATPEYVNARVSEIDGKVTTLSGDLEKSQQRINEVDQKARTAGDAARAAAARAAAAAEAAAAARSAADAAGAKVGGLDKNGRRLVYEVVLNEAEGGFKFGKTDLPDDAKAALDKVITDLQADPKAVFFEIEGHTDNVGDPRFNEQLGMKRAEAVKRYLYETHQVPLHKINVISYGEDKPVSDNKTRAGRAENRRIVVRMLS